MHVYMFAGTVCVYSRGAVPATGRKAASGGLGLAQPPAPGGPRVGICRGGGCHGNCN